MALLEVQGIQKAFGARKALDGAGLRIEAGSFHGVIGPNGSGKSTLLKAIAGAHFADAGTVVFNGQDVTRTLPYERSRAGMGLKFQITAVLPELSVYDNVLLAMQAHQSWCALLIVEHDLDFIRDLCDRLSVLDHGQVPDGGTVEEIQRADKVKKVYATRE